MSLNKWTKINKIFSRKTKMIVFPWIYSMALHVTCLLVTWEFRLLILSLLFSWSLLIRVRGAKIDMNLKKKNCSLNKIKTRHSILSRCENRTSKIFTLLFLVLPIDWKRRNLFSPHSRSEKWAWFLFLFVEQNKEVVSYSGVVFYFTSP